MQTEMSLSHLSHVQSDWHSASLVSSCSWLPYTNVHHTYLFDLQTRLWIKLLQRLGTSRHCLTRAIMSSWETGNSHWQVPLSGFDEQSALSDLTLAYSL